MRIQMLIVAILVSGTAGVAMPQQVAVPATPAMPAPARPGADTTSGTGAISGVVTDATTGRPLAGAVVALQIIDRGPVGRAPRQVTDPRGRFLFRDLPASNDYLLTASHFGYAAGGYGRATPDASGVRLRLANDQWFADANVKLWRLGSISGRVTDEANEPVVGIAVTVYATKMISGQPYQVVGPVVTTDDRGVYRLAELQPGRYFVGALSSQSTVLAATPEGPPQWPLGGLASGGYSSNARLGGAVGAPAITTSDTHRVAITNFGVPPSAENGQPRAYPPTFHPGAIAMATAVQVEIGFNDARQGIDIQLRPVPATRVSGRVEGTAESVANMPLRMMPLNGERFGFGSEVATTLVGADGSFTFENVPEGQYTIVAQKRVTEFRIDDSSSRRVAEPPGVMSSSITVGSVPAAPGLGFLATTMMHGGNAWARTPIDVRGPEMKDVVVRLNPARRLVGRVVFEEGSKRPGDRDHLWIGLEPANGDPSLGLHTAFTKDGDKTYGFVFDGLMAGRYVLGRNLGSWRVTSITWDVHDVTDTGVEISTGDIDGVVIHATDKLIGVTGAVRDERGQPASAGAVIVFPVNRERWTNYGWSPTALWSQPIGGAGTYRLQYLPAGEYYVVAVPPAQAKAWTDPKFLQAAVAQAVKLSVAWGDQKTLDLRIGEVAVK